MRKARESAALLGTAAQAAADSADKHRGHIFNLGHGILPMTPVENAEAAICAALTCGDA